MKRPPPPPPTRLPRRSTKDQDRSDFPFDAFRKRRFADGVRCPRCRSGEVRRWGGYSGRRRFRCQDCGRTFSDFTGTPLAHLKRIVSWTAHCQSMSAPETLREEAGRLGIHRNTAFRWRHRLLGAVEESDQVQLEGLVTVTEWAFPHSEKGSRNLDRAPRSRGWRVGWETLSAPSVWIITARDRSGRVASAVTGRRRPTHVDYGRHLERKLSRNARMTSPPVNWARVRLFARRTGHDHIIPGSLPGPGFDPWTYVKALRTWMRRFRGVASRYLSNYLAWHRALTALTVRSAKDRSPALRVF